MRTASCWRRIREKGGTQEVMRRERTKKAVKRGEAGRRRMSGGSGFGENRQNSAVTG